MTSTVFSRFLILVVILMTNVSWTSRNILEVWVKSNETILVEGKCASLKSIKETVKMWVLNPNCDEYYPEKRIIEVPLIGMVEVSKMVISIQCDRDTKYGFYIAVQNEIEKAYNEMRQEIAMKKFGKEYHCLTVLQQTAINKIYPKRISEAEPNWILNDLGEIVRNDHVYWWY